MGTTQEQDTSFDRRFQCLRRGELCQNILDREDHQHFQSQGQIGSIKGLIKKRGGSKLVGMTVKVVYGDQKEVRNV